MLKPLGDRVLIEPLKAEEVTKAGIIIPDSAKEERMEGKIIALGSGIAVIINHLIIKVLCRNSLGRLRSLFARRLFSVVQQAASEDDFAFAGIDIADRKPNVRSGGVNYDPEIGIEFLGSFKNYIHRNQKFINCHGISFVYHIHSFE